MEEESTLDDCALTLRDVLAHYKDEIYRQFNTGKLLPLDGINVLHHAGVELHISQRLVNQFIVEDRMGISNA
ncbi:MAG: hypothetical protein HXX17_08135 [Geobacteraceae bacterium]|nr:hypothetical protein [Geobacteraceae bacterium]